jgi:hypothetical protein
MRAVTVTEIKRAKYPARYARKDARTRIYRAVFGDAQGHDPNGNPAENPYRRHYATDKQDARRQLQHAENVFKEYERVAQLSPFRRGSVLRALELFRFEHLESSRSQG